MATLPTPGGSDVWGANLNTAIKQLTRRYDDNAEWSADLGYDLEFDTAGTSLPSGWAWVNQGTSTYEQKYGAAIITPQNGTGGDNGHRMITRSLPSPSTWEATIKFGSSAHFQFERVGLALRDSASGKYVAFTACAGNYWQVNYWNSPGSFNSEPFGQQGRAYSEGYMRIKRTAATTYSFLGSPDGLSWTALKPALDVSGFCTPNEIGLFVNSTNVSAEFSGSFGWFRVR